MAVNQWTQVTLTVHHPYTSSQAVELYDAVPAIAIAEGQPAVVTLLPGRSSELVYRMKPLQRGPLNFDSCSSRQPSPWGMWLRQTTHEVRSRPAVYPDYSVISAYNLLTGSQGTLPGIRKQPRRGEGRDFHQLREYRPGDALRAIAWKASSRRGHLVAKDYEEEKDQRVIILLDCGQRMRSQDEELSHFDQALNAILLVSYIALRQGDSLAIGTFGNNPRWLPPQKGTDKMKGILNSLYDLHASREPGDYVSAANRVCRLQPKRSLVILVTNTRDDDSRELSLALKQLQKHHLVLLADLREGGLDQVLNAPIKTLDDALLFASVSQFDLDHEQLHQRLRADGIFALTTTPAALAAQIANHYLAIKRAGVL